MKSDFVDYSSYHLTPELFYRYAITRLPEDVVLEMMWSLFTREAMMQWEGIVDE